MQSRTRLALGAGTGAVALAAVMLVPGQLALTADHFDPPARVSTRTPPRPPLTTPADVAADIADVFAFYNADNVYFAVTFHNSAVNSPNPTVPTYDRNILHTLNISTSPPATSSDISIRWRYGPATNGTGTGVSIENLPGVSGPLVGQTEQILSRDGVRAYAGLRDDPFFFDLLGFDETRAVAMPGRTGDLRFDRTRNFFRNANGIVLIVEIPRARLGAGPLDIHATTARFGGQLS
ncbi:MAG: hypothetical protein ABW194_07700 [Novosphingobium sp.]